jgi:hypothetical protein
MDGPTLTATDVGETLALVVVEVVSALVENSAIADELLETIASRLLDLENGLVGGAPKAALGALVRRLIQSEQGSG